MVTPKATGRITICKMLNSILVTGTVTIWLRYNQLNKGIVITASRVDTVVRVIDKATSPLAR